ncbi:MAG: DUF3352 domain-containing protein [Deltaproteobacteria bacterium]|nr:DUF3352 domain-containing protein [Deltaproteobacteria bacterium]
MKARIVSSLVSLAFAALVMVTVTSVGCGGGCRGDKAPLRYVSSDAMVVIEIPSISRGVKHILGFVERFKEGVLANSLIAAKKALLSKQLGFDIENPDAYRKKGIDPRASAIVSVSGEGVTTLVMAIRDAKALDAYLRDLLTRQLSSAVSFKDEMKDGLKITSIVKQGGAMGPQVSWTFHKKHLLFAGGKGDIPSALVKATHVTRSMKDHKTFQRLRKRLGTVDTFIYVDGTALRHRVDSRFARRLKDASESRRHYLSSQHDIVKGVFSYFNGWTLGVEFRPKRISLRSALAVPKARIKEVQEIFSGKGKGPAFGKFIGPDALFVGRGTLQLGSIFHRVLDLIPPRSKRGVYRLLERVERRYNLNVEKDILALFAGRYGFAIYAPKTEALQQPPTLLRDLSGMFQGVFFVQLTDMKKAREFLDRLERILVMAPLDIRTRTEGKDKIFSLERDNKRLLSWALVKNLMVVASDERMEGTLSLIRRGGKNVLSEVRSSRAKGLLRDGNSNVIYQDLAKTLDVVRAVNLPGKVKLILSPILSGLSKFDDLVVGFLAEDEGLYGEVTVNLK